MNAARHPEMHRKPPQPRIIWPHVSNDVVDKARARQLNQTPFPIGTHMIFSTEICLEVTRRQLEGNV